MSDYTLFKKELSPKSEKATYIIKQNGEVYKLTAAKEPTNLPNRVNKSQKQVSDRAEEIGKTEVPDKVLNLFAEQIDSLSKQ